LPLRFGIESPARTIGDRVRHTVLGDPGTAAITVNATRADVDAAFWFMARGEGSEK
jgi:hypothetical protein